MPRITPEQVRTANHQADIVALIRSRGGILHKQDGAALFKGNCPFHHSDGLPLSVYPNERRYCCATCGAKGDALAFLQAFDGISKRHAYEILQSGQAAYQPVSETPCHRTIITRLPPLLTVDTPPEQILSQVVQYYHDRLLASPAALAYLVPPTA